MYKIDLTYGLILENKLPIFKQFIYEDKKIINESYIKLDYFQNLFIDIKNNENFYKLYKKSDLLNLFPARWKAKKYLKKSKKQGTLIIFKFDFNNKNKVIDCLKFLQVYTQQTLLKEEFNQLVITLLKIFVDTTKSAFFMTAKNISQYSLMFVNNNFTIEELRHEFIHYYQWMTKRELVDIKIDLNSLDDLPLLIADFSHYKNLPFNLDKLLIKEEIIPYANDLVEQVRLFNQKTNFYNKYTFSYDYSQYFNETSDEYIIRLMHTDFYNFLINNKLNLIPFTVFVLCHIYSINDSYFENYIFKNI